MADKKTPFPKARKLKKADGTIAYIWDGKLHNWSGPALIPEGNHKKREYNKIHEKYVGNLYKKIFIRLTFTICCRFIKV